MTERTERVELDAAVKELCDLASEAREFFGWDSEDIDAYELNRRLLVAEERVRVLLRKA